MSVKAYDPNQISSANEDRTLKIHHYGVARFDFKVLIQLGIALLQNVLKQSSGGSTAEAEANWICF